MKHIHYNIAKYPFRKLVEEMAGTEELEAVHEGEDYKNRFTWDIEQDTPFHKSVYSKIRGSKFLELYHAFISEHIKPLFSDDKIVYQVIPTFRVHYPENVGVEAWHKDRDYNHNPKEVNIFMPFTAAYDTNAVWYESSEGKKDFSPIEMNYGSVAFWNGANLLHGNKVNTTGITRVSCDFRVMNLSDYKEPEGDSVISGTKMTLGSYYEVM